MYEGHGHPPVTIASGLVAHPFAHEGRIVFGLDHRHVEPRDTLCPYDIAIDLYDLVTGDLTGDYGRMTIWYHGADRQAIAHALAALPYGREDIMVDFTGEWGGPHFYALAETRAIAFFDCMSGSIHTDMATTHVCRLSGMKGHEASLSEYAIHDLLVDYYGEEWRVDYDYS